MKLSKPGLVIAVLVGLIAGVLLIALLRGCTAPKEPPQPPAETAAAPTEAPAETDSPPPAETPQGSALAVEGLTFARLSDTEIYLQWQDDLDARAEGYVIYRRSASGRDDWAEVGRVASGEGHSFTDTLGRAAPQQFLYRVDVLLPQGSADTAAAGSPVLASNRSVCIDPGHYLGSSELERTELYGYGEGLFMLRLGLALRDTLRAEYGVDAVLTRETDEITIGGYSNGELDNQHLSLRGEFARGQDLFVSLHTNANQDDANGYPTCNQPAEITKTLLFVNLPGAASEETLLQANEIGTRVSAVNAALGIAPSDRFDRVRPGRLHDWSDDFNDALNTPGTVCQRLGEKQQDYYGVLRGAAAVGVPGLIIEHAFHTVAAMRRAAMQGDLAAQWAEADAAGIAAGYGFLTAETIRTQTGV